MRVLILQLLLQFVLSVNPESTSSEALRSHYQRQLMSTTTNEKIDVYRDTFTVTYTKL